VTNMAMYIRNRKVERLAEEIARVTGETKTGAILRALEERRERIAMSRPAKRSAAEVLAFLEQEVWPKVPRERLGRGISKAARERILGYGKGGV
jgi:antitoxin VapB